jgi:hypothetical protein
VGEKDKETKSGGGLRKNGKNLRTTWLQSNEEKKVNKIVHTFSHPSLTVGFSSISRLAVGFSQLHEKSGILTLLRGREERGGETSEQGMR